MDPCSLALVLAGDRLGHGTWMGGEGGVDCSRRPSRPPFFGGGDLSLRHSLERRKPLTCVGVCASLISSRLGPNTLAEESGKPMCESID